MVRELTEIDDIRTFVKVIRDSFKTVADDLGLTMENCPTNPAFITLEKLLAARDKGVRMFGLYSEELPAGFVALENAGGGLYYMERLAVIPELRHRGHGRELVRFAEAFAGENSGEKISIAVINENTVLKAWYKENGFSETGTKVFEHLPFTVCFMEKRVE